MVTRVIRKLDRLIDASFPVRILDRLPPLRVGLPILFIVAAIICGGVALLLTLSSGKRLIESEFRNHAAFLTRFVATRMEHELRTADSLALDRSMRLLGLERNFSFSVLLDPTDAVIASVPDSGNEFNDLTLELAAQARLDPSGIAQTLVDDQILLVTAAELEGVTVEGEVERETYVLILGHNLNLLRGQNRMSMLSVAAISLIPIGLSTLFLSFVLRMVIVGRMSQLLNQFKEILREGNPVGTSLRGHDEFAWLSQRIESMASDLNKKTRALTKSEDRLSHALRGSNDGLWDWDLITNRVYFSPRWKSMLGYEDSELRNDFKTWTRLLHPDDREQAMTFVEEFIEFKDDRDTFQLEFRLQGKEGYRDILSRAVLIRRDDQPVRLVGTHMDITELNATKKELQLAQFSLHNAPVEVFWINEDGRILYANQKAREKLEYEKGELETLHVSDFDAEGVTRKWPSFFADVKSRGTFSFEALHKTSKGTTYPVEVSVRYCHFKGVEYICAFCWDITDRKRGEREIRELNVTLEHKVELRTHELKEANRALESFAYTVSHDLRAPIRAANCFAEVLEDDFASDLPDEAVDYLSRIRESTGTMGRMINSLLDLSRITRDTLGPTEVRLDEIAAQILSQYRDSNPDRSVSTFIEPDLTADADDGLVRSLLHNLLGNSWKFTEGNENAEIRVSSSCEGGETVFSVEDNGAGFDVEDSETLFEPFRRYHDKTEFKGEGIGLATAKRIIDRHGGWIELQSKLGEGTTVRFTLGRSKPAD